MIYDLTLPAEFSAALWLRFTAEAVIPILGSSDSEDWGLRVSAIAAGAVGIGDGLSVPVGKDFRPDISGKSSWHHIAYSVHTSGSVLLVVDGVEVSYPDITPVGVGEVSILEFVDAFSAPQISPAEAFSVRLWGKSVSVAAMQSLYRDGQDGKFLLEPLR